MAYVEYEADGKTIKARVQQKTDTLANWEANTKPILAGEQAFVIDGGGTPINFKIGDGKKKFSELPWWISYDQGQYVQVVGNALPTPTVELGYSFVGPGTYTHAGGNVVAPEGRFSQIVFNGSAWSLKDMGALPQNPLDVEGGALSFGRGKLLEENKANVSYEGNINLFDNSKYLDNRFFDHNEIGRPFSDIAPPAEGWFISMPMPVIAGETYIKSNSAIGIFDSSDILIAGHPFSTEEPFVLPSNAHVARLTTQKVNLPKAMLVKGDKINGYENGQKKVVMDNLPAEITNRWKNVVVVAPVGGQFDTINKALNFISGKDSIVEPWVILLMPGNYVESVNMIGKYVAIYGFDKETTFIRTYTNDYYNPPIDAGGNNHLYNVTVVADDDGNTTPVGGVGGMPAYAIHFDTSGRYEGLGARIEGRAVFNNVRFISHHQHAAGIGTSTNQHLVFETCEFKSLSTSAFRAHNYQLAGAVNQKMTVNNCVMHNPYAENRGVIVIQDPNNTAGGMDNVDTEFQFINTVAYFDDNDSKDVLVQFHSPMVPGAISGKILLGRGSFGNNMPALNK